MTTTTRRHRHLMIIALALGLSACSNRDRPARPDVFAPTPPPASKGLALQPPASEERGSAEILWALRGGLNVAALLCNEPAIVSGYNQLLKTHRALLNDAYASEQARYRSLHGADGPARHDRAMTRLFNGFASVPDRRRFCTMAGRIVSDAVAMPSDELAQRARVALTTLEPGALQLMLSSN